MTEHWYRDVVELSQDAIYVWCDGCFVFANRATARLLCVESPERLIGRKVYDFVHPDYIPIAKKRLQLLLEGRGPLPPQEFKMVRADGEVLDVEAMGTSFNYQGRPALHVVLRDVAERKMLQRDQLRRLQDNVE